MLLLNTFVSLLACCVGFGGFIAAAFGMNLNMVTLAKLPFVTTTVLSTVVVFLSFGVWYLIYMDIFPTHAITNVKKARGT